ncbi:FkbM family methyltransferase [Arthrobacter sp. SIMBA_036]|uniref:FkbM family methyltransferase n=1 Tax=Arthrobacter sp. SIMBA_036 TaxID=3085778 RepID=UPI003978930B
MKPIEITAGGTTYRLDLPDAEQDYIQKTIATTLRPYEEAMLIDIAGLLSPGDLVLDIGANCGNHTLYLSCVAGAEVHAFEPDSELCSTIRKSLSLNGVEHLVTVHDVGVGDADGFGQLVQTAENNRGAQRLQRVASGDDAARIVRLDDLTFPKRIRAIKIDVEGMELDVLNGARMLIEHDRPELYVECQTRTDFERIHSWLASLGYGYLSTFNATPTHHFGSTGSPDGRDRFEQIVKQQVAATYYDQELISRLRKSLTEANLKYRGATAKIVPLTEQLRIASESHAGQAELVEQLKNRVVDSDRRSSEADRRAEAAERQYRELRAKLDASAKATDKLTESAKAHSVILSEVRRSLESERNRVKSLERLTAQSNALSLELEARNADQSRQWFEERQGLESRLELSGKRLQRMRRKANLAWAKAFAAVNQEAETASRLQDVASKLADSETGLEAVTARLEETSAQLADANAALSEADARAREANRRVTVERGLVSRLERSLADSRADEKNWQDALDLATGQLNATKEKTSDLEGRSNALEQQVARLQAALDEAESQLEAAELKTKALRASVTYRLGQTLRESVKSPTLMLRLPVALSALATEQRRRQVIQGAVVPETTFGPSASADLSLDVSQVPRNRAAELRAARRLPGTATATLQLTADQRKSRLRVAAIMDDFTVQSFAPECDLLELSVANYIEELRSFKPSLVFLESAWRGKDNEWGNKVAQTANEVREIIAWAQLFGVPVVLWNKEDPVHYSTFLNTAKLVDHVFTTDIDCIQRYKGDLGHDRVHFLPFACQPALHNPLEIFDREPAFCFAGAYYRRYPDRTRDLESFMEHIPDFAPLEIFDRNFGKTDEQYMFPEEYQGYIVGTLNSAEIDLAYKGYSYAINLNSVKESQSMFARRVFELLASNTTVVSNYSRGLQLMFGSIPVVADSGAVVVSELATYKDKLHDRRRRLAGLRKVMREHTYSHRLEHVMATVENRSGTVAEPTIEVFSLVANPADVAAVRSAVARQVGVNVVLHLYADSETRFAGSDGMETVEPLSTVAELTPKNLVASSSLVAVMVPTDYYGENYLLDMALAQRYSSAAVVGKATYFMTRRDGVRLDGSATAYTSAGALPVRASLVLESDILQRPLGEWLANALHSSYEHSSMLNLEAFDYCRDGRNLSDSARASVSSSFLDEGLPFSELARRADRIEASDFVQSSDRAMTGAELAELFVTRARPGVSTSIGGDGWAFESTLADGVHDYLYATDLISLDKISSDGRLDLHVEVDPGLNLQIAIIYYGQENDRVDGLVRAPNQNHTLHVPENVVAVKVGVRIYSSGATILRRILWEHKNVEPAFIAARAKNLVLTNRYPSYDDLYKNAFVHSRVRRYIDAGVPTEVFVLAENSSLSFREFDGVNVITGSSGALRILLEERDHQSISLHFINEAMWDAIRDLPQQPRIAIWAHGADIQKWSRRGFLYQTDDEVRKAKEASQQRIALWRRIFSEATSKVSIVFVSEWLAMTAFEDLEVAASEVTHEVIHNPIDTERFAYRKKHPNQRLKVLSIRPYASSVYANDLSVEAILLLSELPIFPEMEFRLVGDGPLFDELTEPLKIFPNVILDKRFLSQERIAKMHQEYGVFLCPSRMDTQGVSRDEAMASGLVPVTTRVAAIPEFADESCGELVEPENAAEIAAALSRLAGSARLFRRKSAAAAKRVRSQSAAGTVIPKELQILGYSQTR